MFLDSMEEIDLQTSSEHSEENSKMEGAVSIQRSKPTAKKGKSTNSPKEDKDSKKHLKNWFKTKL